MNSALAKRLAAQANEKLFSCWCSVKAPSVAQQASVRPASHLISTKFEKERVRGTEGDVVGDLRKCCGCHGKKSGLNIQRQILYIIDRIASSGMAFDIKTKSEALKECTQDA